MSDQSGTRLSDEDSFTLMLMVVGSIGAIGTAAAVFWSSVTQWLLEHHVLLAADAAPLVTVPGSEGAGLDLPRLAIAAAVALLLAAAAAGAGRRHWRAGRELR